MYTLGHGRELDFNLALKFLQKGAEALDRQTLDLDSRMWNLSGYVVHEMSPQPLRISPIPLLLFYGHKYIAYYSFLFQSFLLISFPPIQFHSSFFLACPARPFLSSLILSLSLHVTLLTPHTLILNTYSFPFLFSSFVLPHSPLPLFYSAMHQPLLDRS